MVIRTLAVCVALCIVAQVYGFAGGFGRRSIGNSEVGKRSYFLQPQIVSLGHLNSFKIPARLDRGDQISPQMTKLRVQRAHNDSDRFPLSNLQAGQRLRGRVISIADYGLFVDVGTKRDGLVHVRDVSDHQFVTHLENKFIPGQDIDVWVKFVLPAEKKFGLQMFPPKITPTRSESVGVANPSPTRTLSMHDLDVGMEVKGKVIRTTDFGVYVDIGASDVTPFLHRRKMKSNRRQWKYRAGEVVPLGSEVACWVHEVDAQRNRVSLTTYPKEQWADRLLPSVDRLASAYEGDDDSDFMVEDNEELGGDVRAANLRAVRRTLALRLDSDEDDDTAEDDDDDGSAGEEDEEEGEVLSAAEIRRLTANRVGGSAPELARDYDALSCPTAPGGKGGKRQSANNANANGESDAMDDEEDSASPKLHYEESISTEELFESLANRRPYLTLSDLKKWDYVRVLMQDGTLTAPALHSLFQRTGATLGRIGPKQFALFLDLFAEELGLQEDDGSFIDDDEDEMPASCLSRPPEKQRKPVVRTPSFLIDDFAGGEVEETAITASSKQVVTSAPESKSSTTVKKSVLVRQSDDDFDFDSQPAELQSIGLPQSRAATSSSSPPARAVPAAGGGNLLVDALFHSVATKGATHVGFDTLLRKWSALRAFIIKDAGNAVRLRQAFAQCAGKAGAPPGMVDAGGFAVFVQSCVAQSMGVLMAEDDVTAASDNELKYQDWGAVFLQLAEKGDQTYVRFSAMREWSPVVELIEEGRLSEDAFEEIFLHASPGALKPSPGEVHRRKAYVASAVLSQDGFMAVLGQLSTLAGEGCAEGGVEYTPEEREAQGWHTLWCKHAAASKAEEINPGGSADSTLDNRHGAYHNDSGSPGADEEDSDEEVTRQAFLSVGQGKPHVSLKDMLNWDFVHILLAENVLTEERLEQMMVQRSGGNRKGVPLQGFDQLVDELALLYRDSRVEDAVDEVEREGLLEGDVDMSAQDKERVEAGYGEKGEDVEESEEDEEDIVEVDTVEEFEMLSAGKGYVTVEDLKSWDLLATALESAGFQESDWARVLGAAGVRDHGRIRQEEFEVVFDEVLARTGFCEEDGCGDPSHDHS